MQEVKKRRSVDHDIRPANRSLAAIEMDRQVTTPEPKLVAAALATAVKEAVKDAALLNLEVRFKPPCLLKESHCLAPVSIWNNAVRLPPETRVNAMKSIIFQ
ncbi:hypothetical protein [Ensifer sp. YR511]|uniref:hypothetical protein n=1 Tax=Ensifer sp. YR511 TaxID=1855294 RepID=UPI00115F7E92|nr:hypothetical protein [Ensifer sp. YR511]